jgi:DNA polymerase III gamma/tau subunit
MNTATSQLKQLFLQNKLPPALLLEVHTIGNKIPETSKIELKNLAKFILCLNKNLSANVACDTCKSCYIYDENIHPDFLLLEPESSKNITIDQIRELSEFISYKPSVATKKIVLGIDIEKINLAAANALLKSMDDPKDNLIMLYASTNKLQIIPTLLSRLVPMHINLNLIENNEFIAGSIQTDLFNIARGDNPHIDGVIVKWLKNYPDNLLYLLYMAISNMLKTQVNLNKLWVLLDDVIELKRSIAGGHNLNVGLNLQVALNKFGELK